MLRVARFLLTPLALLAATLLALARTSRPADQPAVLATQALITDYPDRALQVLGRSTRIGALDE